MYPPDPSQFRSPQALPPGRPLPGPTIDLLSVQQLPENVNYPKVLWRRKWWILAALILGFGVGVVRVIYQPPVYRASTTIELLSLNEGFMGDAGFGGGANASNIQTQVRILMSARLIRKTAERVSMELAPVSLPAPDIFGKVRNKFGLLAKEPVQLTKQGVETAAVTLRARGVGATRLVEISCESISPEIATAFLNTHTAEYMSQYSQLRSTNTSRTTQWLESQLEEARTIAEQADEKVRGYVRGSGMAPVENPSFDGRLQQLQADLTAAQTDRITKQSRLETAKSGDAVFLEDAGLRGAMDKLDQLQRQKAQLLTIYTPEHLKVKQAEEQISAVERQISRDKEILIRRMQGEYDIAMQRERSVRGAYGAQAGALANQADKSSQYQMLKRESELARQTYNTLLQQLNQISMASSAPNANVRVIDPPAGESLPYKPVPKRDIAMAGFAFAALLGGAFAAREFLWAKKLSTLVATPGHSPNLLDVPELGVIPSFESPNGRKWALPDAPLLRRLRPAVENGEETSLVMRQEQYSIAAEAFRFTLAALFLRTGSKGKATFLITSAGPGEGKTTSASNLALAMCEMGKRVLLIDADLRKSNLHKVFQLNEGPGLRDLILSPLPVEEIQFEDYLQPTGTIGVSLLASGSGGGPATKAAASLLFSQRIPELLARLQETFDVILIDTAPVLHFGDARILGPLTDGVILVVRSGVTPRESIMTIRHRFQLDATPVLGTILNDWAATDNSVYSYHGYAAYYHKK